MPFKLRTRPHHPRSFEFPGPRHNDDYLHSEAQTCLGLDQRAMLIYHYGHSVSRKRGAIVRENAGDNKSGRYGDTRTPATLLKFRQQ